MDPIAPNVTKDLWSQSNDILYSRGMKIFLLHYIYKLCWSIVSFIYSCNIDCEMWLPWDPCWAPWFSPWIWRDQPPCLAGTHPRVPGNIDIFNIQGGKRDCFDRETDWMGAVIKTWGMKTCSGLMKPACLNGFDVETNLSNQSFTARARPKWEMVYLRSDMKC